MKETHLKCNNCGKLFEEPNTSYSINCPNCGDYLFIPSRKLWEDLKANSIFNQ